jgi:hypothetical protein
MNTARMEAGQRSNDGEDRAAEQTPKIRASFKGCLAGGGGWRGV